MATETTAQAEEQTPVKFEDLEGSDLLRPISTLRAWDQARLLNCVTPLQAAVEKGVESIADVDLNLFADVMELVAKKYTVDPEKFEEFATGAGAFNRVMDLIMSYVGLMGE